MSVAGKKPTKTYESISLRRTRQSRCRFPSTTSLNTMYTAPIASARPAAVSMTLRNAGTVPSARPTAYTASRSTMPMTIARPGSVPNSA